MTSQKTAIATPSIMQEKVQLKVLGTSVSLLEPIRQKAEADLGIELDYIIEDGTSAQRIAVLYPEAFDIFDQWFHNLDLIWPARTLQPIDIARIGKWDEINCIPKTGKMSPSARPASGGNPVDRLYVQPDGELGSIPSGHISMLPTVHNADSFAVYGEDDTQTIRSADSWSRLLDKKYATKVAVQNDAGIGVIDLILATQAAGWFTFENPGNLTIQEIDALMDRLMMLRKKNHFKAFWATETEAVALFEAKKVTVASMWWQGIGALQRRKVPVRTAVPKEGFRGWYGGLSICRYSKGRKLDAAYDYLNWWLSGYAGAVMTRNYAHISNPESSRPYMSEAEWEYWYEGKAAREDLRCPFERKIIPAGTTYPGGSYSERMNNIAIWNSVMNEHNYLVRRWNEFTSTKP